jgi:hypothetical protein
MAHTTWSIITDDGYFKFRTDARYGVLCYGAALITRRVCNRPRPEKLEMAFGYGKEPKWASAAFHLNGYFKHPLRSGVFGYPCLVLAKEGIR